MISICIPTLLDNIKRQIVEIESNTNTYDYEIIVVSKKQSAAKNRNECIKQACGEIIVMLDDDIFNFYPNWLKDLITPLLKYPEKYSIVSIRCINEKGEISQMSGDNNNREIKEKYQKAIHTDETGLNMVCSAGIAFRKEDGILFDENYIGAVFEDSDFCLQYKKKFPEKDIIINNDCKLVHLNEMKRCRTDCVPINREYFNKKWSLNI